MVQADIKPQDKAGNMAHYAEWLEQKIQEPVHLLVFPEMFNCGFSPEIMEDAEPENGQSVFFLYMTAHKFQCDVVATLPVLKDGKLYNRLVWFSRDRILGSYDKRHLSLARRNSSPPEQTRQSSTRWVTSSCRSSVLTYVFPNGAVTM